MTARSGDAWMASSGGGACAPQALLAANNSAASIDSWRCGMGDRRSAADASQSREYFNNRESPITNDSIIRDPGSSIRGFSEVGNRLRTLGQDAQRRITTGA